MHCFSLFHPESKAHMTNIFFMMHLGLFSANDDWLSTMMTDTRCVLSLGICKMGLSQNPNRYDTYWRKYATTSDNHQDPQNHPKTCIGGLHFISRLLFMLSDLVKTIFRRICHIPAAHLFKIGSKSLMTKTTQWMSERKPPVCAAQFKPRSWAVSIKFSFWFQQQQQCAMPQCPQCIQQAAAAKRGHPTQGGDGPGDRLPDHHRESNAADEDDHRQQPPGCPSPKRGCHSAFKIVWNMFALFTPYRNSKTWQVPKNYFCQVFLSQCTFIFSHISSNFTTKLRHWRFWVLNSRSIVKLIN